MSQIDDAAHESASSHPGHTGEASSAAATFTRLQQSHAAFLRDLPTLLGQHAGEWAAYAGDRRLAIGPSKRALYRQCLAAGHRADEVLICGIEQPRENVLDDLLEV